MSSSDRSDIAVLFDDMTEFFAIRKNIDELTEQNIGVDIYVASSYSDEMRNDTHKKIEQHGYKIRKSPPKNTTYKVLLEPYPLSVPEGLKYEFRIKYSYSAASAKPDPVFMPEWNLPYDAVMSYARRDADIKSVYTRSYHVPYKKYDNFRKEKHDGKLNLLYLPTFGDSGSIGNFSGQAVSEIKKEYNVIVKAHHALQFKNEERKSYESIREFADEFYDSDTPLEDLLAKADVVLSDNSGAIFESIYSETPVAIFSEKVNSRKLGNINTLQYELVEGDFIPLAESPEDVPGVLLEARGLLERQKEAKKLLFTDTGPLSSDFTSVIKEHLLKDREKDIYLSSHDILVAGFYENRENTERIERLDRQISDLHAQVQGYEGSASWRVTAPLRRISKFLKGER